ncbi:MAG: T9SS-dependent M36 family metallopeptidase [Bacteroidota bacterium]
MVQIYLHARKRTLRFCIVLCLIGLVGTSPLLAQAGAQAAIDHVQTTAEQYGLSEADVQEILVTDNYVSRRSGNRMVYLRQAYQGIGIHQAVMNLSLSPENKILTFNTAAITGIAERVNTTTPLLQPEDAVRAAAFAYGLPQPQDLQVVQPESGADRATVLSGGGISQENIPLRLRYTATEDGALHLAWDLSIFPLSGEHWWSIRIDARDGQVLNDNDWMLSCHFGEPELSSTAPEPEPLNLSARVMAPNSYNVFAEPVESPNHGGRSLQTAPWDLTASPFGWHDTNGANGAEFTITRGNNVLAQEDANGNNGNGYSPDGGPTLDFDFPLNLNQQPVGYRDAAITNLFYWNNLIHDVWYASGFDEVSGNFQENNYGNGGQGGDYVLADAQDGSGLNNANFATPPDGTRPRMQMFLWNAAGATVTFTVNSPGSIAGNYGAVAAGFGPAPPNTPITADLILVDDGTANGSEGCNALTNGGAVNGNIALIDRDNCTFVSKVLNAQNAGAQACVVCNSVGGAPIVMGGNNGAITIPSVMISQADCNLIKAQLAGGVNASLSSTGSNFNIDGDFDNGIIGHEYAHGISNRLTGGPNNSGCLGNAEQMGEGWSDYVGLMLTIRPTDVATTVRGIGTFAIGQPINGGGIRPAPYTTDMGVNPFTYGDITNAGAISQPHGIGFLWCSMLWEMTWALINQYGYDADLINGTGGNNISMALVTEGMRLQRCSPGFVDGRDAILDADTALYGGIHSCLIWQAFAKRGLGLSASQDSRFSRNDGSEAFDVPNICTLFPVEWQSVTATPLERDIAVDWTVSQEVQNRGFQVERKAEGEAGYISIGWVDGKGTFAGASEYDFTDRNVVAGVTYNYRIRQIDLDGAFRFSKVVAARIEPSAGLFAEMFPNPTTGQLNIQFNRIPEAALEVEVFDLMGSRLLQREFSADAARSVLQLDLGDLPAGTYLIKVRSGLDRLVERIVVE